MKFSHCCKGYFKILGLGSKFLRNEINFYCRIPDIGFEVGVKIR